MTKSLSYLAVFYLSCFSVLVLVLPAKAEPKLSSWAAIQRAHNQMNTAAENSDMLGFAAYLSPEFHVKVDWPTYWHGNVTGGRILKEPYLHGVESLLCVAIDYHVSTVVEAIDPASAEMAMLKQELFGHDLRHYPHLVVVRTRTLERYTVPLRGMSKSGVISQSVSDPRRDWELWTESSQRWRELYFATYSDKWVMRANYGT